MHLGLCGHRQAAPKPVCTYGCGFPRTLGGRLPPPPPLRRVSVFSIGYCRTFRPPIGRAFPPTPTPAPQLVNPYMAKSFGWVLPPPPSQTDWVPAGPRPVAARVGVRPAGHSPAFQAQSGFVGPAGDWLEARRLVENLVSAQRGERRAAPPPPPGGGAFICSRRPAWEPAHNHSPLSHLSTSKPPSHTPPATCSSPNPWRTPPPNFSPLSFPLFFPAYPSLAHTDSP